MTDVPLAEALLIWNWSGDEPLGYRPAARVIRSAELAEPLYLNRWGACDGQFRKAVPAARLQLLFRQFHWMVVRGELEPHELHKALLVIPEYRAAIHPSLVPARIRRSRSFCTFA
jgi:hypothetical protein